MKPNPASRHHKPALTNPVVFDTMPGDDPADVVEAAHRTAAILVGRGRNNEDPDVSERLIELVPEVGLATLAELWADRPARSLPGALWRLYLLHEWVQRAPVEVARAYTAGAAHADVYRVIAGVTEPPQPSDLRDLTSSILSGVFAGDLRVALERGAAFAHVAAIGLADPAAGVDEVSPEEVRRARRMQDMARDLHACAGLWDRGDLV
ncbi:MAG: hypothetical protein WA966_09255 [Ornithinimicrobium sp.]